MKRLSIPIFILLLLVLSSCATIEPIPTASGNPEILVRAEPECVKSILLGNLINSGYELRSETAHQFVVGRPDTGVGAMLIAGTQYAPIPESRCTTTMVRVGDSTRVIATRSLVQNPGTGFELVMPIPWSAKDHAQFQTLVPDIERGCAQGR